MVGQPLCQNAGMSTTVLIVDDLTVTADHEGRLVADIVREWAEHHGGGFTLRLSGVYRGKAGGAEIDLDAIEFCRILSGRALGEGLLKTAVMF